MQQYNMLQAVPMSFYSARLYRDVALNWGGKAFVYLFLLLAIITLAFSLIAQHAVREGYDVFSDKIVPQIPVMNIAQGKISTPENHPYYITEPDSDKRIAVIDTSGQFKTPQEENVSLLITGSSVIMAKKDETRTFSIPAKLNGTFDPPVVSQAIMKYLGFVWLLFFIPMLALHYIYRILQAMLYSIIGKFFAWISGTKLSYMHILPIALVALTPTIVFFLVMIFIPVNIPVYVYFLISMAYLLFGVMANKTSH